MAHEPFHHIASSSGYNLEGRFVGDDGINKIAIEISEGEHAILNANECEVFGEWLLRTGRQLRGVNPTTEIYLKRIDDE